MLPTDYLKVREKMEQRKERNKEGTEKRREEKREGDFTQVEAGKISTKRAWD